MHQMLFISVGKCFDVQMKVIRLCAVNNTHRENLIQYKNLKNKILAPFDIFGVFTQFKFYNSIKTRQEMFKQGDSSSR